MTGNKNANVYIPKSVFRKLQKGFLHSGKMEKNPAAGREKTPHKQRNNMIKTSCRGNPEPEANICIFAPAST